MKSPVFRNPVSVALLFVGLFNSAPLLAADVYKDRKAPLQARAEDLFNRLTANEKIKMLGGTGFTTQPIPRLDVPGLVMADTGQGVRGGMKEMNGLATAFPAGVTMAATCDPDLIGRVGRAIGVEALNEGIGARMMLGPAVYIHRSPLGGRNGEYMSEDPYLAARLAASYIKAMQGTGVAACIKHFACNNQESNRFEMDVNVNERALREIYLPALDAAKAADVVIVCVSTMRNEGEGSDRPSMDLPNKQAELIRAVAAVNPKTIVVLNNGTPVSMSDWIEKTPAVLEAYLPGQEGGAALAAILFGDINPSGKLPDTLAAKRSDYPDYDAFPGANHEIDYKEGIYVGYRHFDKEGIAPLFPFGHGLSYTTFNYSNLKLSQPVMQPDGTVTVTVDVTNTGKCAGAEVVQLYMHDPLPKIDRPVRELKGFAKIALKPDETKSVSLKLTPQDLSYFDVSGKQWKADAGNYEIEVGSSSRDIRLKAPLTLDKDFTESVPLSQEHYKG